MFGVGPLHRAEPPREPKTNPHESSEGFRLVADKRETVHPGPRCERGAPKRTYDVAAINVDITLNRYLDHDPQGRMYVLESDVDRVRREEAQNARARSGKADPAVSMGLQGDAIQPLTLRVHQGECLRIKFRNALRGREPASLHVHGSSLRVAGSKRPAIATNPKATVAPGARVTYEWMVHTDAQEGTYYFHSHGRDRRQTGHGLFGAVVVEPRDSVWIDPRTGDEARTGWDALIRTRRGPDFREFAIYYHEIGDESYQFLNRDGDPIPLVDPLTTAYRPAARALNYRSEPFMNRLELQKKRGGRFDESISYSSYAFGDPATPILRAYVGDPVKQRVVHAGSEVFHVHHVHGGAIRWHRQSEVEDTNFAGGLVKRPPLLPKVSERIDSQGIGPSETFDIANECGSGGCQQSVGDFLFHCHVAHHYFAGMWGIWRVYNTEQNGRASTDSLPPLVALPDRDKDAVPAVTSDQLKGKDVDWSGKRIRVDDLASWVERQLPPRGSPRGNDASVLDWERRGEVYLGEPETRDVWPGYRARAPGTRPPIRFDPRTGKLAYPFLRPHLGKRPPFAPNHGPAPFLDPTPTGADPPRPGADGESSLCPSGTKPKTFYIRAITLPITLNARKGIVDGSGEIFVLSEDEDAVRGDNGRRVPLAIRANAGEDCVDVVLTSELEDTPMNHGFAKVNAHIHFVQFDVQASDGVITGFNYEQSVRPYAIEGDRLVAAAAPGAATIDVARAGRFVAGSLVGIGVNRPEPFEVRRVTAVSGTRLTLDRPVQRAHAPGDAVSTEFVRYRWYPDVQFGTAYFHDHVNAVASWRHGLFGALISEPPGSTYHDPRTGAALRSGAVADIHTKARVSADVTGSFRELALFVQDDNPITSIGRSSGSALNLRVEPLDGRHSDPSRVFSSDSGDPLAFRVLVGGTNDVHTFHLDGHWFRAEPYSRTSEPVDTVHLGISERYDLFVPKAGGPRGLTGDYLYANGRTFKLEEGSWGIVRVVPSGTDLRPLPGVSATPRGSVCPPDAPRRSFDIAAVEAPLAMLDDDAGKLFVPAAEAPAVIAGKAKPSPLVLRVNTGDCIRVNFSNRTTGPVSFHPSMVVADPNDSGLVVGRNGGRAVSPQSLHTYTFYADPQMGEAVGLVRDGGDFLRNGRLGLYGAIVVGPKDARYTDPKTGANVSSGWAVDVVPKTGRPWRDFALFMQDEDAGIGTHKMPYNKNVDGVAGINYRKAPLVERLDGSAPLYDTSADTPVLRAFAGDRVRIRVVSASSEQAQVFSLEGHEWPVEPGLAGSDRFSSVQVGGLESITIVPDGGAGGRESLPGDYLYGDHREPFREAGMWGIFRVSCPGEAAGVRPLPGSDGDAAPDSCAPGGVLSGRTQAAVAAAIVLVILVAAFTRRRRRRSARFDSAGPVRLHR